MSRSHPPPSSYTPPQPPTNLRPPFPIGQPIPPPPSGGVRGGGFGRQLASMFAWGVGISLAFAGMSALFGGRRTQEIHHIHQQPPVTTMTPTNQNVNKSSVATNPAANRPIFNCTVEEEVLRQVRSNTSTASVSVELNQFDPT